jgi:hypothetical protein
MSRPCGDIDSHEGRRRCRWVTKHRIHLQLTSHLSQVADSCRVRSHTNHHKVQGPLRNCCWKRNCYTAGYGGPTEYTIFKSQIRRYGVIIFVVYRSRNIPSEERKRKNFQDVLIISNTFIFLILDSAVLITMAVNEKLMILTNESAGLCQ